jgi:quinol monooxygenase YgiN
MLNRHWPFPVPSPSSGVADAHKGPLRPAFDIHASILIEPNMSSFVVHRIIIACIGCSQASLAMNPTDGVTIMRQYAISDTTVSDAVAGGGLLVVAQWEAKEGEADRIADILSRFLPEAQKEAGAKLFLISRAKDNPAQFLFYELFRDEAAFKAHQESAHFKTYIAGQALPLLAKRERAQYALL